MDDLFADAPKPVHGIRTGIGGWTYPEWRDNFYPKGLVQKRELEYASRRLTAIEINGTFTARRNRRPMRSGAARRRRTSCSR